MFSRLIRLFSGAKSEFPPGPDEDLMAFQAAWAPPNVSLSAADCRQLRNVHAAVEDGLESVLEVLDKAHADFAMRGRNDACMIVAKVTVEASALRFSRALLNLRAEAHGK